MAKHADTARCCRVDNTVSKLYRLATKNRVLATALYKPSCNPDPKPALCQLAWQSRLTLHDAVSSTTPCQSYRLATSIAMRFGNSPTNLLATLTLNPNPKPALCQLEWQSMLTLHDAVSSTTPCQSYRLATINRDAFWRQPDKPSCNPDPNPNPKPALCHPAECLCRTPREIPINPIYGYSPTIIR